MSNFRIAVDIGGTFVDAVAFNTQTDDIRLAKALTTPEEPSRGVLNAVESLGVDMADVSIIVHGTTLGLNAIIERRGAKTGLITNKGFRDIFEIGRGNLPDYEMYNLSYQPPAPLIPRRSIGEVAGRLNTYGEELIPLDEKGLIETARGLIEAGELKSLAVSFLYSFLDPAHEQKAKALLREHFPDVVISAASDIVREHREYERSCTAVLEAYIRPIFERYLDQLQTELAERGFAGTFLTMRSSGGAMTAEVAKSSPLHSVLSGPAGGIVGASHLAQTLKRDFVLTLDTGGTSVDACVIKNGAPDVIHETMLDIYPALIPVYDIRCIGAGGGSIAWTDTGLLKVGPKSAGSVPGPIAYNRGGTEPTTTDAAAVLGFLHPSSFEGTSITLDAEGAARGIEDRLGDTLKLSAIEGASGIFRVIAAQTVGALRQITVERGLDPKDFTIVGFGGAGPLVATLVAHEMEISEVIIPQFPSVFSAWGMMSSDIMTDVSRTFIAELTDDTLKQAFDLFDALGAEAKDLLVAQGMPEEKQQLHRRLDMRYVGQEHTLSVALTDTMSTKDLSDAFHKLHLERYGHQIDESLEIVNLRVGGVGLLDKPRMAQLDERVTPGTVADPVSERDAYCFVKNAMTRFGIYRRQKLSSGHVIKGPAIIDEGTCSTVVYSGQTVSVDDYGCLVIRTAQS